jgi:hypothetical protein
MSAGYKWKRLQRATPKPPNEALIEGTMRHLDCDRATAIQSIAKEDDDEIWINDLYQVVKHPHQGMAHLNIRRIDGFPGRDWRHFQQIKNELCGEECEAVELYPAESRLIDQGNKYHLWVVTDPAYRFPFGWEKRDVDYTQHPGARGLRQRPPMQFKKEKTP